MIMISHKRNNSTSQIRQSNFELLRIVCILLVVAGHMFQSHSWDNSTPSFIIKIGLQPFTVVAVNCFVLISGYFSIRLNWRKLIQLNNMVTFWCIVLCLIAIITGLHELNITKDILWLFPVLTKRYWFISVYFALCLIAPFLNNIVEKSNQRELRNILIILCCIFVALPTLSYLLNFPSITEDAGYGLANLILLYLIGRYIKLYYKSSLNKWIDFGGYTLCMFTCGITQLFFTKLLGFEFTSFISYDSIFPFIGAILLFMFFSKINLNNKFINYMASFCLAIYIIHLHPWTFNWFYQDFMGGNRITGWNYLLFIISMPLLTFLLCLVLEQFRLFIFIHLKSMHSLFINRIKRLPPPY